MRRFVSVFFVVALFTTPALAQEATDPEVEVDEASRVRARALFQEGVAHLDASEWEDAREKFEEAYDLVHEPSILLNLAQAQVESGQLAQGAASYRRFLEEVRSGPLARHRRDAQAALNAVEARMPRLRVTASTLQDGDVITLDGEPFDRSQLGTDVRVAPGEHLLLVMRGDQAYANESFTLDERERHRLDLPLTEAVAAPTPSQVARTAGTHDDAMTAPDRRRRRRLGLGIGLGAGVPMLITIIAAIAISR